MPKARPFTPTEEKIGSHAIRWMSRLNTWVYRASGGKILGKWIRGAPVGILVHRGRKSGRELSSPLLYLRDGDRLVLVASKGGMSKNPLWYENLVATPECAFEIGSERRSYRARTATPEERAAYWPRLVEMYRDYASYQDRTDREIPVVVLEPR
jgi:F420H(2)-dependent quinone reductase